MDTLDLHGTKHKDVEEKLLFFLNLKDPPYRIITGNSEKMKKIVKLMLAKYELGWHYDRFTNTGCFVVTEKEW